MRRFLVTPSAALLVAVLGMAYACTLAPGITWANDAADSGDLAAAAATLGVAHPTGYPTYLLLARLFQFIPLGDLAYRANLFSACAAIGAALLVALLARVVLAPPGAGEPEEHWRVSGVATLAALALGLSPRFWSQAVVAEVHALNALFDGLLLRFILDDVRGSGSGSLRGILVGLALGNHVTIALPAALWLASGAIFTPPGARRSVLARRVGWASAGLLVYLYLPLRAAAHPPINWGDPHTWEGFWWVVSGQPYRELAFGLPREYLAGRAGAWASLLVQQFGWPGLLLGCYGLVYGAPRARAFVWFSAALALAYSAFAIGYNTPTRRPTSSRPTWSSRSGSLWGSTRCCASWRRGSALSP